MFASFSSNANGVLKEILGHPACSESSSEPPPVPSSVAPTLVPSSAESSPAPHAKQPAGRKSLTPLPPSQEESFLDVVDVEQAVQTHSRLMLPRHTKRLRLLCGVQFALSLFSVVAASATPIDSWGWVTQPQVVPWVLSGQGIAGLLGAFTVLFCSSNATKDRYVSGTASQAGCARCSSALATLLAALGICALAIVTMTMYVTVHAHCDGKPATDVALHDHCRELEIYSIALLSIGGFIQLLLCLTSFAAYRTATTILHSWPRVRLFWGCCIEALEVEGDGTSLAE